jgi:HSP20 family molecular chaperone IbpA
MNTNDGKPARTNKTKTTLLVGVVALLLGLVLGGAAAETGTGLLNINATSPAKTPTVQMSSAASSPQSGSLDGWNPFQAMRDMQAQMDRSFDRMFDQFRTDPQFNIFKDNPGYSLSLDVRDLKDHYEVRAYLPDAKTSDVHVSLQNGQTLNVEVGGQQTESSNQKNAATRVTELSQYEQMIRLPAPVKAGQMKIKRNGHELVITIPKAA